MQDKRLIMTLEQRDEVVKILEGSPHKYVKDVIPFLLNLQTVTLTPAPSKDDATKPADPVDKPAEDLNKVDPPPAE
jgi:hypothetical protein